MLFSKLKVLLLSLLALSVGGASVIAQGPEAKDAKQDTKVSAKKYINNTNKYGAFMRCPGGDYFEITNGVSCYAAGGQDVLLKVYEKDPGLPDKVMIYEVTAHNNWNEFICDDKGAIERGYAATFQEIVQNTVTIDIDVCTTVTQAGHNTTESEFNVREHDDGVYVEFRNLGGHWQPTGGFPDTTGEIKVNFDKISGRASGSK